MNWRYRLVLFLFVFFFLAVVMRLGYWQIVRAQELAQMGRAQYGKEIKLTPKRGEIFTSDGFAIAANKLSYLVFANPKEISDVKHQSEVLGSLLSLDPAT